MATLTATASRSSVLGRYSTPQGDRKLCARVKDGQTVLTDEPTNGRGPIYPVDVIPAGDGIQGVEAIVHLYLRDACSNGSIPMTRTMLGADSIPVNRNPTEFEDLSR